MNVQLKDLPPGSQHRVGNEGSDQAHYRKAEDESCLELPVLVQGKEDVGDKAAHGEGKQKV